MNSCKRTREKRVLLSRDEEIEVEDLLRDLTHALGFRLNFSELVRASLTLVLEVADEYVGILKKAKGLGRPRTVDFEAALDFECELADLLRKAVKRRRAS